MTEKMDYRKAVIGRIKCGMTERKHRWYSVQSWDRLDKESSPGAIVTALTHSGRTPEQVEQYIESSQKIAVIGRVGTTQDVANLALFLASEDSSFISGEIISVDGGRTDRM